MKRSGFHSFAWPLIVALGVAGGCGDTGDGGAPDASDDAVADAPGDAVDVDVDASDTPDTSDTADSGQPDTEPSDTGDGDAAAADVADTPDGGDAADTPCFDEACLDDGQCLSDADCQDGLYCNGDEVCMGATTGSPGTCVAGTPPVVDDGIACSIDTCDEESDSALHVPDNAACNDGEACNGLEVCDAGAGCVPGLPSGDLDSDGDGFTGETGDCDDCNPLVNPMALELPGDDVDNDCDGSVDGASSLCDGSLALGDTDPAHAAAAIDLCRVAASASDWGLVGARYVRANGTARVPGTQVGLLSDFGSSITPVAGASMLGLSSGHARDIADPDACGSETCATLGPGIAPPGFPQSVPGCPDSASIYDDAGFEMAVRAPSNVTGFEVSYLFASFEFPEWVCGAFNDQFIVLISPAPAGSINGNVAFDSSSTPIGVNAEYITHCDPASVGLYGGSCPPDSCTAAPDPYCPNGAALMNGTGFNEWTATYSGATGWLTSRVPVTPGQVFTVRFAIWDAGDQATDSTVLIDGFRWLTGDVSVATGPRH